MEPLVWQDTVRMPTLDERGSRLLKQMLDHPHAPKFHNRSGSHLSVADLAELNTYYNNEIDQQGSAEWQQLSWLPLFVQHCLQQVPFYRQYDVAELPFMQLPTICRADLSADVSRFVPDHLPLDRLLAYTTSGTTGHPLIIPSHPQVAARYSCFHKKALRWNGVDCADFSSDLAIILAGYQQKCFTYAAISPYLNDRILAKLNFHPDDWNDPQDRQKYLDHHKPDLISGDPVSLMELAKLGFSHRPQALLSTSMALTTATRTLLQQRFTCPLLDLYSLNEAGPVATSVSGHEGFKLLQSRLLVEILGPDGRPLTMGERGEITLTGGFNDYLPLLRYRTGDYARLQQYGADCYLLDLEGRPPVQFRTRDGEWLNNVDVTHLLQPFAMSQFSLHQYHDARLSIKVAGAVGLDAIRQRLESVFQLPVTAQAIDFPSSAEKLIQYTSDLLP